MMVGTVPAGTTAYTIPKIDEYLKEQGFDKEVRDTALLALSAGIGATVGGDTASTANNVGQVQWNYLSHRENERLTELRKQKSRLSNAYGNCVSQRCAEITREIQELENLSKQRDKAFDAAYANCRAGKDCHQFYYLHVTQRNEWNKEGVELFRKQYNSRASQQSSEFLDNWEPLPSRQNTFHNFTTDGTRIMNRQNGEYPNTKYVHKNGQFEVIVDSNGNIIMDPTNAGIFNYYPSSGYFVMPHDFLHTKYDINPWSDFGNGNGDKTTYHSRHSDISGAGFGKLSNNSRYSDHTNRLIIDTSREDAIRKFNEVDKKKR